MGRWENTKKIRPFRGVYLYGESKRKNDERERIREIDQAKRRELTDNNCEKATLAVKQNLDDDYAVPNTQAEVEVPSVAEEVDKVRPMQPEPMDTISDKDRLLAVLRKHGYETEEEWRAELKRRSDRKRTSFTDEQLAKLADELNVDYIWTPSHFIILDDAFQNAVDDFYGAIDDMVGTSFGEKKSVIKKWYLDALRDPMGFGEYERMKRMMVEYYGLKETVNDNGTPIGNYGKYIHFFDDTYDKWRKEDIYPEFGDITYDMDKLIEQSKINRQVAKYKKKQQYRDWKDKQQKTPAETITASRLTENWADL